MTIERRYAIARVRQVAAMLFVYATFYVCRLAFSASKKGMIEQGAYTPTEIGYVGSAMLFAYAIGKIVNGFIADRVNVKKYIMFGLFVSALANLLVGFHLPAMMLAVIWFVNGFAQASGSPCCVVALSRWGRGNGWTLDFLAVFWIGVAALSVVCAIAAGRGTASAAGKDCSGARRQ